MSPRDPASSGPSAGDRTGSTVRLVGAVLLPALLAAALVAGGAALAVGSHHDEADYDAGEASDFTVHTYEGDDADQRQPGAEDRSYWTESIIYQIPEDETVYLTESVTYRPMPADCGEADIDVLGIDRDATYEGEREVDESVISSVQSYSEDTDARDRYEREAGEYGDLSTADDVHVERIEVQWYGPDEIGTPVDIYHGDRFVSAQSECFDNPDAAGWYRWAAFNEGEYENGSTVSQDEPTFAHWYWICDCEDRQDAVETLGPPPSETGETPSAADGGPAGDGAQTEGAGPATSSTDGRSGEGPGDDSGDGSATAGTADGTATVTDEASGGSASPATRSPEWGDIQVRTPAAADGSGFTPGVAVVGLLAALAAIRRR